VEPKIDKGLFSINVSVLLQILSLRPRIR